MSNLQLISGIGLIVVGASLLIFSGRHPRRAGADDEVDMPTSDAYAIYIGILAVVVGFILAVFGTLEGG